MQSLIESLLTLVFEIDTAGNINMLLHIYLLYNQPLYFLKSPKTQRAF